MNIRHLLFALIPFSTITVWAQTDDTASILSGSLSLSKCVQYAQSHSPLLLPLEARVQTLELSESMAKQAFLPSVNASIGENASFGRSQGIDGVYRDVSSANTDFQIGASWEALTGGRRWWSLMRSREELKTRDYIIAETKDQIALSVTEDYVSVLLAEQMVEVANENLSLSTALYDQTKVQVELGKLPLSQQIQIESQVGQDQLSLTEAEADLQRAVRILLLDMGIADGSLSPQLPTPEPEEIADRLQSAQPAIHSDEWVMPGTRVAQAQYDLAEYDIKSARAGYFPTLSLSAGYSNGYNYAFGEGVSRSMNSAFADQIKRNGRTYVGVALNIPIYNKGQVTSQVRQAQIQRHNLKSQLVQRQFDDTRNITLATTELKKAEEQYRISIQNVELTRQALDMAEKEFKAGRITAYEWDQARNKHLVARGNYLRSIYNRLLRTINLTYFNTGELPLHLAE